jgi:SPP1 gp7 family putative phage head morphogenesis protein
VAVNEAALAQLARVLPAADIVRLRESAQRADTLEAQWAWRLRALFSRINREMLDAVSRTGELPAYVPSLDALDEYFLDHAFAVMSSALSIEHAPRARRDVPRAKLWKPKKTRQRMPRTLPELRALWDQYRKAKKIPKRIAKHAEKVRKLYLKTVQDLWKKHGDDFIRGKVFHREAATRAFREELKLPQARAQMTMETETTRYYNGVRRSVYDASVDVTHYLYVPIRDFATTKWCRSRDGIVFKKGDPLLDRETPPIHWNCRSEILPLTMQNAQHRALILDMSRARRRRSCEPLPAGWNHAA